MCFERKENHARATPIAHDDPLERPSPPNEPPRADYSTFSPNVKARACSVTETEVRKRVDAPLGGAVGGKGGNFGGSGVQAADGHFAPVADGNPRRDLNYYGDLLMDHCWVVIDDYFGSGEKAAPIRAQVDEMVSAGMLVPFGYYGWSTWIGQWKGK